MLVSMETAVAKFFKIVSAYLMTSATIIPPKASKEITAQVEALNPWNGPSDRTAAQSLPATAVTATATARGGWPIRFGCGRAEELCVCRHGDSDASAAAVRWQQRCDVRRCDSARRNALSAAVRRRGFAERQGTAQRCMSLFMLAYLLRAVGASLSASARVCVPTAVAPPHSSAHIESRA